mmetsp:Transcript_136999/g.238167  ORF Transcript_136999/g.238167 Transcript_136999/m.238167 type:complete len:202 (+) Transcript_136999:303-908(+)
MWVVAGCRGPTNFYETVRPSGCWTNEVRDTRGCAEGCGAHTGEHAVAMPHTGRQAPCLLLRRFSSFKEVEALARSPGHGSPIQVQVRDVVLHILGDQIGSAAENGKAAPEAEGGMERLDHEHHERLLDDGLNEQEGEDCDHEPVDHRVAVARAVEALGVGGEDQHAHADIRGKDQVVEPRAPGGEHRQHRIPPLGAQQPVD